MKYTKKELADSLKNKTDSNSKSIIYFLALIYIPVFIAICIAFPRFLIFLTLIVLFMPKILSKKLDVALGRVDFDDFLVLGNISMKKSEFYAFDNNIIIPNEYIKFFMSDFFIRSRTEFKNEYLNHYMIKINASRLRKSKVLVEIFDFTLMDTDRLEIFDHICKSIFIDAPYKNTSLAEKAFINYLKEIAKIYDNTKVKYCSTSRSRNTSYWRIKNIEKQLQKNPRPFINFVMNDGYTLLICHRYNLAGEQLEQLFISESDFAKILYYDVLEAKTQTPKVSNVGKFEAYLMIDRM